MWRNCAVLHFHSRTPSTGQNAVKLTAGADVELGEDHPAKFIGASYDKSEAQALAERLGWTIAADGLRWRRVVASPRPLGLVEIETVRSLADAGVLVVCGGGGGVPVIRSDAGELTGVEAVAITLKADRLLVLTDVPAIIAGYGTPDARPIQAIDTVALSAMTFPAGSMGPKVEACLRFVTATGQSAAVGALTDAAEILAGRAGTTISAARPVTEPVRCR
jgi:carbamate kinase